MGAWVPWWEFGFHVGTWVLYETMGTKWAPYRNMGRIWDNGNMNPIWEHGTHMRTWVPLLEFGLHDGNLGSMWKHMSPIWEHGTHTGTWVPLLEFGLHDGNLGSMWEHGFRLCTWVPYKTMGSTWAPYRNMGPIWEHDYYGVSAYAHWPGRFLFYLYCTSITFLALSVVVYTP